ncbi:hypothetical protein ACVWZ4_005551 [Bradyrhizobium sp. USDA 4472]
MNIPAILSAGAIGLGFLLAFLTYLLLRANARGTPIYVFMCFCFALVLVGAILQYMAFDARSLQSQVNTLQVELQHANEGKPATEQELQKARSYADACQQKSLALEKDLARANQVMSGIAAVIPESIKNLQDVNTILTGNYCAGGSSGVPIWGGRGTTAAAQSTKVISNLSAAKSAIESVVPQK